VAFEPQVRDAGSEKANVHIDAPIVIAIADITTAQSRKLIHHASAMAHPIPNTISVGIAREL
jgi:hypothetical protein